MENEILKYDASFTEATFLTKADHIYMMILNAIIDKDMNEVKHYLSENVYNYVKSFVDDCINRDVTRIFDEMNVKTSSISNYYIDENGINIVVDLTSRYMDYYLDNNGNYLSGINDHRIEKEHRIVFTKKLEVKTLNEARRCPSCGSTLDVNATGICPYCKQTIDMSNYDYIVTSIDSI
jgi:predicted lipid-binding transport protein (Tim44 family)